MRMFCPVTLIRDGKSGPVCRNLAASSSGQLVDGEQSNTGPNPMTLLDDIRDIGLE
jgi:hypothetical protein